MMTILIKFESFLLKFMLLCKFIFIIIFIKEQNQMEMNFDDSNPPQYQKIPPLRFVKPYHHIFKTHAKKRWLKKKLIDMLTDEFKAYTKQYYQHAIQTAMILINNKPATKEYIIKDNDLIIHKTLRVEPPVLDLQIKIISQDENFLVVNKPPGITIHSGGGFHYNTLIAILYFEFKKKSLYLLHRLDKCTSGVILFSKNKQTSLKFHEQNSKFIMKKMYYARVGGNFDAQKYSIVDQPIVCLNYKDGIYSVLQQKHKDLPQYQKNPPKQSITQFKKLWYDQKSDSSLVQCYPKTGRTHQIRVHLKFCGFPILNDTVYGGRFIGNLILKHKFTKQNYEKMMQVGKITSPKELSQQINDTIKKKIKINENEHKDIVKNKQQLVDGPQLNEYQWDYKNRAMQICLHSHKYTFQNKSYEAERPYWFQKDNI